MDLQKGTLWDALVRTSRHALAIGAQLPIKTEHTFIQDGNIRFFVRILANLKLKDKARQRTSDKAAAENLADPFLPPEPALFVGNLSDTHAAILNKFNVVEHHLLIITREFEEQDMLLTLADFEALWLCMAEYEGLAFYNGGREAGASQDHKHLQMVPLPLAPEGPAIPIGPLLAHAPQGIGTIPGIPFQHAFVRLVPDLIRAPREAAIRTFDLYGSLLQRVNMHTWSAGGPTRQSSPYCFIVTREWMLLVPRTQEFFEDISLNALAFAGSLFLRDQQQLERLRSVGPLQALRTVAR